MEEDEIRLRIDLRNITKIQLEKIIEFINENELRLKYDDELYDATRISFWKIIEKSGAYQFVCNPERFLRELKEKLSIN